MGICRGRMPPGRFEEHNIVGIILLYFAMSVCKCQHSHGRFFSHGHHAEATSWKDTSVVEVMGAMTS